MTTSRRKKLILISGLWFAITGYLTAVFGLSRGMASWHDILLSAFTLGGATAGALIGVIMALKYGTKVFNMPRTRKGYFKIMGYGALSGFYAWTLVMLILLLIIGGYIGFSCFTTSGNDSLCSYSAYSNNGQYGIFGVIGWALIVLAVGFGTGGLPAIIIGPISLLIFYCCFRNYFTK